MGVFSKLKNIFYDEEVVDEEVKEEKRKFKSDDDGFTKELEIKPKIEEIKVIKEEEIKEDPVIHEEEKLENPVIERDLFKTERKFNFTELDDNDNNLTLPPRKSVLDIETRSRSFENKEVNVEQPKVFKPSPVISPIYGILDKDYKKEEIVSRSEESKEKESNVRNYDSVRRKAYGTLEDDLEDTLNKMNRITPEDIKEKPKEEKIEVKDNKIDEILDKMEKTSSVSVGELEDKLELEGFDDEEEEVNVDKTMTDSTLEHDLFNLIDSMYDDKEE